MRANQKQNQPQHPDDAVARSLAWDLWSWLGEKTRYRDLVEGWIPLIIRAKKDSELDWDRMRKIVRWSALENEFTVANLRVSRDPGKSLFVNQWENVVVFFEADEATQLARARKKWKHGACKGCDMAEANPSNYHGHCDKCEAEWQHSAGHVMEMIRDLHERGIVWRMPADSNNESEWFLLSEPVESGAKLSDIEHLILFRGKLTSMYVHGGGSREMTPEERLSTMAEQMLDGGWFDQLKELHLANTGFQVEEAE
jgi:hypothetical protein